MIEKCGEKIGRIVECVETRIAEINQRYRNGPDLYFYKRVICLRNSSSNIISFLENDYCIEILYATLVAWDMNSRRAKLKYFDEFKNNVRSCRDNFEKIESLTQGDIDVERLIELLKEIYLNLHVMQTKARLVANSKLLHFLFPKICIPADRSNTLEFFYGNHSESFEKYGDIVRLSFEIMKKMGHWERYFDNGWNTTIPKMIDNAIILLVGKSVS